MTTPRTPENRYVTPHPTDISVDVEKIRSLLLSDGQWYEVEPETFEITRGVSFSGHLYVDNQTPWFTFMRPSYSASPTGGKRLNPMSGPLSSIKAIRHRP